MPPKKNVKKNLKNVPLVKQIISTGKTIDKTISNIHVSKNDSKRDSMLEKLVTTFKLNDRRIIELMEIQLDYYKQMKYVISYELLEEILLSHQRMKDIILDLLDDLSDDD